MTYNFTQDDWDLIQKEIDDALLRPKLEQLDNISVKELLQSLPEECIWLICMGRFRVRWKNRDEFQSWWSPREIWWIGVEEDIKSDTPP